MSDFAITFLGTGTSIGVPVVGCDCETCRSDDPRDKRLRSSIYVETGEVQVLVDTGPDLRMQCLREKISHADAVIYTHGHMDHVVGFDDLRRFTPGADASLPIYALPETMADLRRMFAFAFNGENHYPGYIKPEPHLIEGVFAIGDLKITPLPVRHGKVDTVGFLFEQAGRKLAAYVPDCKAFLGDSLELMRGVDTLLVDALRRTPHVTHMNFEEALAVVAMVKPRQAWFTHIADEIMHARDEPTLPEGTRIAYDGLRLEL